MRGPFLNGHAELALTKVAPAYQVTAPPPSADSFDDGLAAPAAGGPAQQGSPEARHVLNLDPHGAAVAQESECPLNPGDGGACCGDAASNVQAGEARYSPEDVGVSPQDAGNSPEAVGDSPPQEAGDFPDTDPVVEAQSRGVWWRMSSGFVRLKRSAGRRGSTRSVRSLGDYDVVKERPLRVESGEPQAATLPRDKMRMKG